MVVTIQGYSVCYRKVDPDADEYYVSLTGKEGITYFFAMVKSDDAYVIRNAMTVPAFIRALEANLAAPLAFPLF